MKFPALTLPGLASLAYQGLEVSKKGAVGLIGAKTRTSTASWGNVALPAGSQVGDYCFQCAGLGTNGNIPGTAPGFTDMIPATGSSLSGVWGGYKVLTNADIANGYVNGPSGAGAGKFGQSIIIMRGITTPIASAGSPTTSAAIGPTIQGKTITKSAKSGFVLQMIAAASDAAGATYTINGMSGGFFDPLLGGVWAGGAMMLCPSDRYANGTNIVTVLNTTAQGAYGAWDLPLA